MSEKLIPTEVFESGPDIPASVVVVSATLSTGQRNTSRTQFAGKRLQSKSKRKRGKENSCRCQLPPNPFCPETLHILRQMDGDRRAGGADTSHLAGLARQGCIRAGVQGDVRVNHKVLRVLAGSEPLASRGAGLERCWGGGAGLRHNIGLQNQRLQTPGVVQLPALSPN